MKLNSKCIEASLFNSKTQQNIPVNLKQSTLEDLKKVIREVGPMFEPLTQKEILLHKLEIKRLRNETKKNKKQTP